MSLLFWLFLYKSFTENDGDLSLKYSLIICSFIFFYSFLISFKVSSGNFNGDILRLVFAFDPFIVSGIVSDSGWNVDSNINSCVGILSNFFTKEIYF